MKTIRHLVMAIAGVCTALMHPVALAQSASYPSKLIRVVVPFPPGGASDIMARNISQMLSEAWKQPIVVENRAGAGGMIGADAVAKSQADGYTYLAVNAAHTIGVSLVPKAPYQLQKDLQPVAIMGLLPLVPVVRTDSPIRSLQDLVATSKSRNLNP